MLETAEIGQSLSRQAYDKIVPDLRTQLIQTQVALRDAGFPVIVIVTGDDLAGRHEVVDLLSEWLDPRFIDTRSFGEPSADDEAHPLFWRYWRALPPAGRMAVFTSAWGSYLLNQRLTGGFGRKRAAQFATEARAFETTLAAEGALILKVYLHVPPKKLRKQAADFGNPLHLSEVDVLRRYVRKHTRRALAMIEQTLAETTIPQCPWNLIESTDRRFRNVAVARLVLDRINAQIKQRAQDAKGKPPAATVKVSSAPAAASVPVAARTILSTVDLSLKISGADYQRRMAEFHVRLNELAMRVRKKGVGVVAAFEGWDAAGKGGTIRRLVQSMSAPLYRVIPIAAPTAQERAYHYLWRFWRQIPPRGGFVVFDRTWYGRVLVERVEGFATQEQWSRAYDEINDFERQLTDGKMILLKFWLHISKDEQLRRFKERERIPFKRYKIGPEDYRNREKWDQYELAVNEMIARTSTPVAPWSIVPSNDKDYARVHVIQAVVDAIEKAL
jgi:AMP-polyphosphate phosphotransferase